jgi:hypothetical protein
MVPEAIAYRYQSSCPGLTRRDPGIHVFLYAAQLRQDVDGRVKPKDKPAMTEKEG